MLSGSEKGFRLMWSNREFKLHVYGKRQTSESSREFLKNRKWADKNSSNKLRETTHLAECRKNSKRQVKRKLGLHVAQIRVWRLT